MNGAQAHLLVNHLPVLGTAFAALLLAAGLLLRKDEVSKAGVWALLLAAVSSLPAYFSGEGAEEVVEHLPGVLESLIHDHEEAAEKALAAALVMGATAAVVLARFRARGFSRKAAAAALVLSLPALGLMAWTAHLGGLVRHPELGPAGAASPAGGPADDD